MIPVSSNYWRGNSKCEGLGFRFPSTDDFFEAINFGLLNKKKNTSFGTETEKIDWIWISTNNLGMSHGTIASRQGDVAVDTTDVRHWILCIRD